MNNTHRHEQQTLEREKNTEINSRIIIIVFKNIADVAET